MDWKERQQLSREVADYCRAVDKVHELNRLLERALKIRKDEYDKMVADPKKSWLLQPLLVLRAYGLQDSDLRRLQNYDFIYEVWLVSNNPNWSGSYGEGVGRTTQERLRVALTKIEEVYLGKS